MLAVLEEGIHSYASLDLRVRNEATRWIYGRQPRSIFSFEVICETLDLEPSAVRKVLANAGFGKNRSSSRREAELRIRPHLARRHGIVPPEDKKSD
jgi:hypothetical protein